MGALLIRRREMVLPPSTPTPTLIYELASATSTQNYDTGCKPFASAMSFTILCENYTATGKILFKIGTGIGCGGSYTGNNYMDGGCIATNTQYAFVSYFNAPEDSDTKKCGIMFATDYNKNYRRIAWRYNHLTRRFEACCNRENTTVRYYAPGSRWWLVESGISRTDSIVLNGHTGMSTRVFRVYNGLLSDAEINDFLGEHI